uniref:phosphoenolpyruvate carboxykinase (ATP) n=1 Tax=Haptolina ericina TaxID=156174 RepID=A0A7S3EYP6_9EUKA
MHATSNAKKHIPSSQVIDDVRRLLSGTSPQDVNDEVASANVDSRANKFAGDEDIKHCAADIVYNASPPVLVEAALQNEKGSYLTSTGALSVRSGAKTGRSPKDKRLVSEPGSVDNVWWGPVNIKLSEQSFMINRERAIDYLNTRERIYVVDGFAGWDPKYRVRVRVICVRAYHALFMRNMLVMADEGELEGFVPDMIIFNAGGFPANRYVEGMTSSCSVDLHLGRYSKRFGHSWSEMVILGTQYAGEMKKGILTLMMYLMPLRNQLCLHSSANEDDAGNVSVFFGLSGTGKTTLSADPRRKLIGDDEHVWTDEGVFNVEGGCYAKCIALTEEQEPDIYRAIRFGAVVENVVMDEDNRNVDYDDVSITENTRCAYPLQFIPNAKLPAVSHHPNHVILLTCDGYGVLPPVSKLSKEQVIYHFISGYTSKMAGTEEGITKPIAAFSACYGEPFLVWHPVKYATMLAERLEQHQATAWLLNTGWVGGAKGKRCPLKYTRAIVDAIHSGELVQAEYENDPVFRLTYPKSCPGVPSELLDPASSWADKTEFKEVQHELAGLFEKNFAKYASQAPAEVIAQGPAPPAYPVA